jgi:hypothetical protein
MHKKSSYLTPLELQKQLLLAESELNRAQMVGDMAAMTEAVRIFSVRIKTFSSISASAAVIVAGLTAFQHAKPVDSTTKPSWVRTVIKGAGLLSTLWLAFRSRNGDHKDNQ